MTALLTPRPQHKPPYPWFGGKSRCAPEVWRRFGDVRNFVDPFFGSMAMLFARPEEWHGTETVNDADSMVANFWRAVQGDPLGVAEAADNPVNENDLHSRHVWLRERRAKLTARLEGDPAYWDAEIAGWWCWGQCCWIGGGWTDLNTTGPWNVVVDDEGLRQLVNTGGKGQKRQRPDLHWGKGVNRQRVALPPRANNGVCSNSRTADLPAYFQALQDRLRRVRVCCGDWTRVCGPTPTVKQGLTAVFLDPPYSAEAKRENNLYAQESATVAHDARRWAIEHGDAPKLRIALCGYSGEHVMPRGWTEWAWKAKGGYSNQSAKHDNPNAKRERIWFSPNCLP